MTPEDRDTLRHLVDERRRLELVPSGEKAPRKYRRKKKRAYTHCKRGHPLIGENVFVRERFTNQCAICKREYQREYDRRRRRAA